MREYTKKFQFGKVDYNHKGQKRYAVELEITLKLNGTERVFSASGGVWNHIKSDYVECGQMIDNVYNEFKGELQDRKTYEAIMSLWEKWHLNDMHAECEHQRLKGGLFVKGLKVGDKCKTCGYGYGTAWNYQEIVKKDLLEICKLLELDPRQTQEVLSDKKL